ncbi:MAG: Fe-S cluster assembly protein SufD [Parachlamydiaceae bacterium]
MTSELTTEQERFHHLVAGLYNRYKLTDSLQRLRAKYWDHFLDLGLPDRKNDVFKNINLRQLFSKEFSGPSLEEKRVPSLERYFLPECRGRILVFHNGFFRSDCSELEELGKGVLITSLNDAMKTFGPLLSNQTTERLQSEKDPFVALNGALSTGGCFIYLSPKTEINGPIQILQVIDADEAVLMITPKTEVFMGVESRASFVSTAVQMSGDQFFVNASINFSIGENAQASLTQTALDLSHRGWYFEAARATMKRDSSFKTICVSDGAQGVRFDYRADLVGENAECHLNGLWALKDKREVHHHVFMNHQAPECRSMQFFKGILNDSSHAGFEGKIYIHREAQKTQAFQLNNNLILNDLATVDSKPNLEIFADDVKASHGATVGQLDEDHLFYLMTRGMAKDEARKLLTLGFCDEMLEMLPLTSLREQSAQMIYKNL